MADSLKVDPDRLRSAADQLADVGDQVKGISSSLHSQVDALGEPWGDDSTGHQFADGEKGYLAQKDAVGTAVTSLAGFVGDLAESLRMTVDAIEQLDGNT